MKLFIACICLVLVSATVAKHRKDWSDFVMPGCEDYTKALMKTAVVTDAMEEFNQCKDKESKEEKKECFWNTAMNLVEACDAAPSDECKENAKKVFKM